MLTENFELKLRNKDLENEIQWMHYSPNNTASLSESKAFEIRTDLVTHTRTPSPAPNNINSIIRSQAKTLPNNSKDITNKKKGAKESKQQNHKSQISRENKGDTNRKSTSCKKVKVLIVSDLNLRNVKEEKLSNETRRLVKTMNLM